MKNKIKLWLRSYGSALTEVPGWPDAPVSARVRRALPALLPCIGMLVIVGWNFAFQAPRARAQRAALAPLLALESNISSLRLAFSEQQATEIAARAAGASRLFLASPAELPEFLQTLKKAAAERGWEANFFTADTADSTNAEGAVVGYLPVRGKLTPAAGNAEQFASLESVLERFSSLGKRIDLIRLGVRADEHRWLHAELNFRLVYPLPR